MSGKSQDDIVSLLRNVDVGGVVRLTVSRQTSDSDLNEQPTTTSHHALDCTDDPGCRVSTSNFAPPPPGEQKEKQSSNGASSPALRCLATKTDENDNTIGDDDSGLRLELIELSIAVGDDESEGLGVSIKGMSSDRHDHGLFIKKIIEGRAAAKVSRVTFLSSR